VPTAEQLPPLIARSPLGVFDEAVTVLRLDAMTLFGIAVIILLPLRLVALAAPGSALRDARPDQLLDIFVGNLSEPGAVLAAFVTIVLESLALFAVAASYGEVLAHWYAGRSISVTDALLSSIRRSPGLLVAWIIVHLLEALLSVFTVGMGVFVIGPILIATAPVMGAERAGPLQAIRRSTNLAAPKWIYCLLVYGLTGLGALLMRLMIEFVPSFLGLELLGMPLWAISGVADVVASVVQIAFVAAAANILYLDLRVRREGVDLHLAMQRVFEPERSSIDG
jgi:hypothetical protein